MDGPLEASAHPFYAANFAPLSLAYPQDWTDCPDAVLRQIPFGVPKKYAAKAFFNLLRAILGLDRAELRYIS
jgi:hypothetical protein